MEFLVIVAFCIAVLIICCLCCAGKNRKNPMFTAPVVVTTATQQVPFTPGSQMHQTNIYPNQIPYPMGQQGYGMPMPASNQQSYPMPQAGYQPYPAGGAPYPPGPHENMNPPSYDQVVGTTTTTTENYAKQAPYNPSYPG
ncbi:protein shisa-5 isoform X6 [Bradysia coprophila]|uniref:protein shisa-5 isoform X6 n=1 Tax=Bradysia coprophila TaxID=38358 RepID=UPI00187DD932|nr:protein shisa-5 isoform X6 [Bradysia coprophila]XP_037046462.1 protein shisa-5 isoform X6 [Bradysia coprophila]